jgi:hypothetical protein
MVQSVMYCLGCHGFLHRHDDRDASQDVSDGRYGRDGSYVFRYGIERNEVKVSDGEDGW